VQCGPVICWGRHANGGGVFAQPKGAICSGGGGSRWKRKRRRSPCAILGCSSVGRSFEGSFRTILGSTLGRGGGTHTEKESSRRAGKWVGRGEEGSAGGRGGVWGGVGGGPWCVVAGGGSGGGGGSNANGEGVLAQSGDVIWSGETETEKESSRNPGV
jgi:hypothetical protein